jgi:very-short-patch-repair endonuclease
LLRGSALEVQFHWQLASVGLAAGLEREHKFHPTRRWRLDFAWPDHKLAVEIDGGIWANGRHNRGAGIEADCQKYLAATLLGWRIIRATPDMVKSGELIKPLSELLNVPIR